MGSWHRRRPLGAAGSSVRHTGRSWRLRGALWPPRRFSSRLLLPSFSPSRAIREEGLLRDALWHTCDSHTTHVRLTCDRQTWRLTCDTHATHDSRATHMATHMATHVRLNMRLTCDTHATHV